MKVVDKYNYFINNYEENGLPEKFSAKNFFDEELFDYIINNEKLFHLCINENDLNNLFKEINSLQFLKKILYILFSNKVSHMINVDINVINNNINNNEFIKKEFLNVIKNLINTESVSLRLPLLFSLFSENNVLLYEFLNELEINEISIDFIVKYMFNSPLMFEKLIKYTDLTVVKFAFLKIDAISFFEKIESCNLEYDFNDLIVEKINSMSYLDKINVLSKFYNVEECKPEYLCSLYQENSIELKKENIKNILLNINNNNKEDIKLLIKSEIGEEVLLTRFLDSKFYEIINILGLDKDLYVLKRKNKLKSMLDNYNNYSLDTVKSIFSLYYFGKSVNDSILNLKTILEYANKEKKAYDLVSNKYQELLIVYNLLISDSLEVNPNNILSEGIILDKIVDDLLNIFKFNLNISIKDIDKKKMSNDKNVDIYVIDDKKSSNNNYFLIHSISLYNEDISNIKEKYINNSKTHDKLCFSLLGKNKNKVFSKNGIIFGYNDLSKYKLYSAVISDAQTNQHSGRFARSTLFSVDEFIEKTGSYNELSIFTDKEVILPDYILSINREPTEIEIKVAKMFNIPIFLWYTKDIVKVADNNYKIESYDYGVNTINIVPNEQMKKYVI